MAVVSGTWHKSLSIGDISCARVHHSVSLTEDSAYLFGGSCTTKSGDTQLKYFNDLYKISVIQENLLWEKIQPKSCITPLPRDCHSTCFSENYLYLFGGKNQLISDQCFPEVFRFSIDDQIWSKISTSGPPPRAVGYSTSTVKKKIYIFGGILNGFSTNDVSIFNLNEHEWTPIKCTGMLPDPRCDHGCEVVNDMIYIFGGSGTANKYFDDLYHLNTVTLEWSRIKSKSLSPSARAGHSFVAHRDKDIYLWGGCNISTKETRESSLYKFSLGSKKWKQPVTAGLSTPREILRGHCAFILHSSMFIVGGIEASGEVGMESVYALRLINPSVRRSVLEHMLNDLCKESNSISCWLPTEKPKVKYSYKNEDKDVETKINQFAYSCLEDTLPLNSQLMSPSFQEAGSIDAHKSLFYAAQVELAHAKQAFENNRADLVRLLERERSQVEEMVKKHKKQNEMWWNERVQECDAEREKLRKAWKQIEVERADLTQQQEKLEEKAKQAARLLQEVALESLQSNQTLKQC